MRIIEGIFSIKSMKKNTLSTALFIALAVSASNITVGQSEDMIQRALLVDMARSQYNTLCGSEIFKQCMGFTDASCSDLSSTAIEQCLLTLPEEISPETLDNSALESCPKQVFEEAGFTEEQAGICFDKAMQGEE